MKIFNKLKNEIANTGLKFKVLLNKPAMKVCNDVEFISQFASAESAELVLKDKRPKTDDHNWPKTGANSISEYVKWVTTTCGMACTAMCLKFFYNQTHQTITLAKDAQGFGVYQEKDSTLSDMHYREYVSWVRKYNLNALLYSRLSIAGIKHILSAGGLVIVSVNPNIRGYKTANETQRGGHLVLLTGYDTESKTVTIQNPSGFVSQNTHKNHTMSSEVFEKFFAGRGIAVFKV